MSGNGKPLNRAETAEFFGVQLTTVDSWRRAGCPCEPGDGRALVFHSAAVANWLRERDVRLALEKAGGGRTDIERRNAEIDLQMKELKLAQALGTVVAVDDVAAMVADEYATVRGRLLSIPSNVVQALGGIVESETAARVSGVVDAEIREALDELTGDLDKHRERDADPAA
ncbi:terminase small subunit [Azospirillum sp. sgz301742]